MIHFYIFGVVRKREREGREREDKRENSRRERKFKAHQFEFLSCVGSPHTREREMCMQEIYFGDWVVLRI